MPDAYIAGRLRWTKVTHKASDGRMYRVVRFFHPRLSCMTTHISADFQRITLNASCMTISGERTEQLDIFCRVNGFTSDFLSFIDVEFIWFFHRALQLLQRLTRTSSASQSQGRIGAVGNLQFCGWAAASILSVLASLVWFLPLCGIMKGIWRELHQCFSLQLSAGRYCARPRTQWTAVACH